MDAKMRRRFACALYVAGGAIFIYYFLSELDSNILFHPLNRLILIGAVCLCVYFASRLLCKTVDGERAAFVMRSTFRAFFLLYLLLLLTFTLFDDAFGRNGGAFELWGMPNWAEIRESVNLVPFKTIRLYIFNIRNDRIMWRDFIVNIVGNICAFMPMAFFLPLLFDRCKKRLPFYLTVTLSVVAIEVIQLLTRRGSCDVDDLILNVLGAAILYEILRVKPMRRLIRRFTMH